MTLYSLENTTYTFGVAFRCSYEVGHVLFLCHNTDLLYEGNHTAPIC
jgi:hypothetical protein